MREKSVGKEAARHTPGPWNLYAEGKSGGSQIASLGREIPAGWGLFREPPQMAEDEEQVWMGQPTSFTLADARLIAAAPDLLEALEVACIAIETPEDMSAAHALKVIRAAINKTDSPNPPTIQRGEVDG